MHLRKFALAAGSLMLAFAFLSSFPTISARIPFDSFDRVVLFVFGLTGILASRIRVNHRGVTTLYARGVFGLMAPLSVFDLAQDSGFAASVYGVFSLIAAYFAFGYGRYPRRAHGHALTGV